jgi:uncharacterized membrane protein
MADITSQVEAVFSDGRCGHTALFAVKNATAGDTFDVSSQFRVVKRAGLVAATTTTIASVTVSGGTILTIPAGPSNDGVWVIAYGVSA